SMVLASVKEPMTEKIITQPKNRVKAPIMIIIPMPCGVMIWTLLASTSHLLSWISARDMCPPDERSLGPFSARQERTYHVEHRPINRSGRRPACWPEAAESTSTAEGRAQSTGADGGQLAGRRPRRSTSTAEGRAQSTGTGRGQLAGRRPRRPTGAAEGGAQSTGTGRGQLAGRRPRRSTSTAEGRAQSTGTGRGQLAGRRPRRSTSTAEGRAQSTGTGRGQLAGRRPRRS